MTKTRRAGFSKKRRRGGRKTITRKGGRKTIKRRGGRKTIKRKRRSRVTKGGVPVGEGLRNLANNARILLNWPVYFGKRRPQFPSVRVI